MTKRSNRPQISVRPSTHALIKAECERRGVPMSKFIEMVLDFRDAMNGGANDRA